MNSKIERNSKQTIIVIIDWIEGKTNIESNRSESTGTGQQIKEASGRIEPDESIPILNLDEFF